MSWPGETAVGMDGGRPRHLLAEANPVSFLDAFFDSLTQPVDLLLADPGLPPQAMQHLKERERVECALCGTAAPADPRDGSYRFPEGTLDALSRACVFMLTGGTTGAPRFARHDWNSLAAAARGFAEVFPGPANSVCLLPLWHVGGLMQAVRARVTEGRLQLADWDAVRSGDDRPNPDGFFLSLVPTQLERLMEDPSAIAWLKRFRAVFVGGAPIGTSLLGRARADGIPLAPAYGMTETAAQVSVLMPGEFLAGGEGVGRPFPHASIKVVSETGEALPSGQVGRIMVSSDSMYYGYGLKGRREAGPFLTGDLGMIRADGSLAVIGRSDDVIISGGEKILPGEVEVAIRTSRLADEVAVFGRPDDRWGAVVCAVLSGGSFVDAENARATLRSVLPTHKIPRVWMRVERLPRNRMGKLDRGRLTEMMEPI